MKSFLLFFLLMFAACSSRTKSSHPEAVAAMLDKCPSFLAIGTDESCRPVLAALSPIAEYKMEDIRAGLAIFEQETDALQSNDGRGLDTVLDGIYKVDVLLGLMFDRRGKIEPRPFYVRNFDRYPIPKRGTSVPVEEGDDGILRVPVRYGGYEGPPNIRPRFVSLFDYCRDHYPLRPKPLRIDLADVGFPPASTP